MSAPQPRLPHRQTGDSTNQPGGHSAKNARRAGAPTSHESNQETPIMSTRSQPRQRAVRSSAPTISSPIEPSAIEGDCPSSRCRGTYVLTPSGQVPEHATATSWTTRRRCPCSGWLARNPRRRKPFYVEGVHFL